MIRQFLKRKLLCWLKQVEDQRLSSIHELKCGDCYISVWAHDTNRTIRIVVQDTACLRLPLKIEVECGVEVGEKITAKILEG